MSLTLVFRSKYKWSECYFSIWCSGNRWKILTTNQFLVSAIFFTNINLCSNLFLIIAKKASQIRNKVVFGPLQCFSTYFHKSKEIRVLGHMFPNRCFMLFLVTMFIVSIRAFISLLIPLNLYHYLTFFPADIRNIPKGL